MEGNLGAQYMLSSVSAPTSSSSSSKSSWPQGAALSSGSKGDEERDRANNFSGLMRLEGQPCRLSRERGSNENRKNKNLPQLPKARKRSPCAGESHGGQVVDNNTKLLVQLSQYQQLKRVQLDFVNLAPGERQQFGLAASAPEVAASAMVSMVRLILVILMCVLLVKLLAPRSGRRNRLRATPSHQDSQLHANRQTEQEVVEDSKFDTRKLFNFINFNRQPEQAERRKSQPELLSGFKARELQLGHSHQHLDRRRRHSDSSLAHLKLPPGPTGLPFLGYLPFVGREIHLTLTSLSERYGPIYQIFLGGIRVVVLNDASLVRQAFKQPVFSGRPDTQLTRILQGYGIVNSDGALWKEQRAFLHTALRKLGAKSLMSGSNGLEAKIQNQVKEFVNDLSVHASEGKPCQVRPIVARAVSSVVGSIVMNLTYRKYEEKEKFDRLIELMQEGFRLFTIAMPLDFIPIFRFLPGVSYAYKKMKRNRAETSAFFKGVAEEHRKYLGETFNLGTTSSASSLHPRNSVDSVQEQATSVLLNMEKPEREASKVNVAGEQEEEEEEQQQQQQQVELENIVARDLVDAYLVQQKKHEKDGKENYFSDQQLVQIMSDIFSAGLETVTSTIEWSILFLILNTHCQAQIQEEIERVIGRHRMPQLEDLSQMPYTEATIYEVLRRSNVIALGNAHATLDDASIGGYKIPKGTQVLPNLYGIHMNPKLWNEPDRFDPSRFIVNERAHKPDYFIPFSVGRRMCLGDVLAKMEVFLFLVGLLQKYDLSVAEEDLHCPPQVKGTIGVSNTPASFRVALRCHRPAGSPEGGTAFEAAAAAADPGAGRSQPRAC